MCFLSGLGSNTFLDTLTLPFSSISVTRIVNFGAFVELLPGKEGLLRIGNIAHERIEKVEDVLNVGDEVEVKVTEIDEKGRVNVSRKALLPKPKKDHK